ncbi:mitotic spindle checkpoint protein BUB3, WD repeat superfamily [Scheffersomyces xylosifermentans]|uniref:mitotic spindle checkpoint protein BUB3, WD repeat superfamily n=1 Tax=Scheffersomyces xylosifermentans TaxID=1304137 RepID=UPI00315D815F
MAVHLTPDQRNSSSAILREADPQLYRHRNGISNATSTSTEENHSQDRHDEGTANEANRENALRRAYQDMRTGVPESSESGTSSIQSYHEFELNQSESLTFLYNLLYDDNSMLTKADILSILNALKIREDSLPFTIDSILRSDIQGVNWPPGLKKKFYSDRFRVGKDNWFHNIPGSRENAIKDLTIKSSNINTDFFKFHKFFSKLKLHITHFQLRNLVCCGSNIANGIYYPSSYYHDHNLQTVQNSTANASSDEEYHSFFKINRLMPDNKLTKKTDSMRLDCLIDSRTLSKNSNNRISTLCCNDEFLVCGTFEGGFILSDVSDPEDVKTLGEYHLTSNSDGITNHIIINDRDNEVIVSSNDRSLRVFDLERAKTTNDMVNIPFAVNCSAINPTNSNELLVTGDHLNSFIIDKRTINSTFNNCVQFKGHKDFGFSCDWSTQNPNLLLTGNQDTCVRLWDKRKSDESLYAWSGSLGSSDYRHGGPVRNCKFSYNGEYISWAESLDHIGIMQLSDLQKSEACIQSRVQSIDFIGKCTGLNFAPIEGGHGEQLIIGVNDCPLGGILSYKLESQYKPLDFDFHF